MVSWRPQAFRTAAIAKKHLPEVVDRAVETVEILRAKTPGAQPILSLKHLAHLTGAQYMDLRRLASRGGVEPYRVFRVAKRPLGDQPRRFRTIVVPSPWLMSVQRWINHNVLELVDPHEASVGFSTGDSLYEAAAVHCECQWLLKIDVRNFFESITEAQVYRVFEGIGYQPLVAFELARICTRVGDPETRKNQERYKVRGVASSAITSYSTATMGHVPQGAPTSPRIGNLVARDLDTAITALAVSEGLRYTRYADDLIFSTKDKGRTRAEFIRIIGKVYGIIADNGFMPNTAKTVLSPPGARKVVLGVLVDRGVPKLTKEYKAEIRKHLYYLSHPKIRPAMHANRQGGATTFGLRRHVLGLIQHARQIECVYGDLRLAEFNKIRW